MMVVVLLPPLVKMANIFAVPPLPFPFLAFPGSIIAALSVYACLPSSLHPACVTESRINRK